MDSISSQPRVLVQMLARWLHPRDVTSLSLVSKALQNQIADDPLIWREISCRYFPPQALVGVALSRQWFLAITKWNGCREVFVRAGVPGHYQIWGESWEDGTAGSQRHRTSTSWSHPSLRVNHSHGGSIARPLWVDGQDLCLSSPRFGGNVQIWAPLHPVPAELPCPEEYNVNAAFQLGDQLYCVAARRQPAERYPGFHHALYILHLNPESHQPLGYTLQWASSSDPNYWAFPILGGPVAAGCPLNQANQTHFILAGRQGDIVWIKPDGTEHPLRALEESSTEQGVSLWSVEFPIVAADFGEAGSLQTAFMGDTQPLLYLAEFNHAGKLLRRRCIALPAFVLGDLERSWLPTIREWVDNQKRLWDLRILVKERGGLAT